MISQTGNDVSDVRTLTRGQQPHSPVCSLQQVVPEAQLLLSSHLTSVTAPGSVRALSLVNQGMAWGPFEQEERWGSQVWPLGQQWFPSLQQTAWGGAKVAVNSPTCDQECQRARLFKAHLRQGAAAPLVALVHEAAGCVLGAAGSVVAHVLGRPSWSGNGPTGLRLQGRDLLQPGQAESSGLVTWLCSHVTFVAFGAAVLTIGAAHSLDRTTWSGSLMLPGIHANVRFNSCKRVYATANKWHRGQRMLVALRY